MIAAIVDIETTGTESSDQIIEIGSYLLPEGGLPQSPFHCLVAPTIAIPPTASAVHHITDEDVANAAPWDRISTVWYAKICDADVLVAHNAAFERRWLGELVAPRPWVCTYKCAMRAWPEAPSFGNQALRYWLKPEGLDRRYAMESHRALPDAYVTAFLFRALLTEHPIETLIRWSDEIAMPPKLSFGKHKGMMWSDAPFDYLEWIAFKSDLDPETKALAEFWMDRRMPKARQPQSIADERATLYLTLAEPIVRGCNSPDDLTRWWREEGERRAEYGIVKGSQEFDRLVAMCAERKQAISVFSAA